jgi:Glycosyltransferase family 87
MRAALHALASRRRATLARAAIAVNGALGLGFAAVLYRNLSQPGGMLATDFTVFWSAWTLILRGHAASLYDAAAQAAAQESLMYGMHFEGGLMAFLNPPHAALAGVPFGWLAGRAGEQIAFIVWTAASVAGLAWLVRLLLDEWRPSTPRDRWLLVSAVLGFYPVFCALKNGQPSVLLALAVLGVYRAVRAARPWAGAAWLLALSIKPQLMPIVAVFLAASGCWRMLVYGAALIAGAAVATGAALGPAIWIEYVRQVPRLERFWGSGTPDYMINARGALLRVVGLANATWVDPLGYALWLTATAAVAAVLVARRVDRTDDARPAYAWTIAIALLFNPHLFVHDAIIWIVPIVLFAAALRDADRDWLPFVAFALAWPFVFAVASSVSHKGGRLPYFDPHTWLLASGLAALSIGYGRQYRASVAPRSGTDRVSLPSRNASLASVAHAADATAAMLTRGLPARANTQGATRT